MRCGAASGASSSGRTSTRARSHEVHLVSTALLSPPVIVPRMTCGRKAAALFWSSSLLARFFCLVRRACRFRADSTLRAAEVWKEARDVAVDNDDDADENVAAAVLDTENKTSVPMLRDRVVMIHAHLARHESEAFFPSQ